MRGEPLYGMKYQQHECGKECQGENGVEGLEPNSGKGHFGELDCTDAAKNAVYQDKLEKKQSKEMKLAEIREPA